MEILNLIDGYATLIIKLLEDRDMYEESPQLYPSSLKIFNECNGKDYHINQIDVKDKNVWLPDDKNNLSEEERTCLSEMVNHFRRKIRKEILINFVEFEFIKTILNDCTSDILNSISEENKLLDYIEFKNHIDMKYTLN